MAITTRKSFFPTCYGEDFVEPFQDRARDIRCLLLEAPCEIADQASGFFGIVQLPGLLQGAAYSGMMPRREAVGDIARLVDLTASDGTVRAPKVRRSALLRALAPP